MIDDAQLCAALRCSMSQADKWVTYINDAMDAYGINTPDRQSAFLAQIGHESGRLVYVREIWGPTVAQLRYEGRRDLGNWIEGDGKRFMGRGLIQITGRTNYQKVRDGLRERMEDVPDFETEPQALEQPKWAALSAAWFWDAHGLNELADAGEFETITRRINGGLNGQAERVALYEAAQQALA